MSIFFLKKLYWGFFGIGASIRISQEIQCLPYAGFYCFVSIYIQTNPKLSTATYFGLHIALTFAYCAADVVCFVVSSVEYCGEVDSSVV